MKRILSIIVSFILILSLCSCGEKVNKEDYTSSAKTYVEELNKSSVTISNYGQYIFNYWNNLNKFSGVSAFKKEDAIKRANEFLINESDETRETMDKAHNDIVERYAEFENISTKDEEINDINNHIKDFYEYHCELYSCVTDPTGTISEYGNEMLDLMKKVTNEYEYLCTKLNIPNE